MFEDAGESLNNDAVDRRQRVVGLLAVLDAAPFRQLLAVAVGQIEVHLVLDLCGYQVVSHTTTPSRCRVDGVVFQNFFLA